MSNQSFSVVTTPSKGVPPQSLLTALLSRTRWKMLAEMASGELFMVKDLAKRVDDTEGSVSKHLAILRRAGITTFGPGRLHRIADAYLVSPGSPREMDFGVLVARLPDSVKG